MKIVLNSVHIQTKFRAQIEYVLEYMKKEKSLTNCELKGNRRRQKLLLTVKIIFYYSAFKKMSFKMKFYRCHNTP